MILWLVFHLSASTLQANLKWKYSSQSNSQVGVHVNVNVYALFKMWLCVRMCRQMYCCTNPQPAENRVCLDLFPCSHRLRHNNCALSPVHVFPLSFHASLSLIQPKLHPKAQPHPFEGVPMWWANDWRANRVVYIHALFSVNIPLHFCKGVEERCSAIAKY